MQSPRENANNCDPYVTIGGFRFNPVSYETEIHSIKDDSTEDEYETLQLSEQQITDAASDKLCVVCVKQPKVRLTPSTVRSCKDFADQVPILVFSNLRKAITILLHALQLVKTLTL